MADPLFHLICGGTGAGKSTEARRLAAELGALRFSIDEWMTRLFWEDAPAQLDFDWAKARVNRCVDQMRDVAAQAAGRGVPCVFDAGFTTRADRARVAEPALAAGIGVRLHWLDVDREARWARVERRNAERGETFSFPVTREMFDFIEGVWQAPDADEMARCDGRRIG